MTNPDQHLIHHLTTALGAIQVTETENSVALYFENTTAGFDFRAFRSFKDTNDANTTAYVFEVDTLSATYYSEEDGDANLVTLEFRKADRPTSVVHIYMKPSDFKKAISNMQEMKDTPTEGETK